MTSVKGKGYIKFLRSEIDQGKSHSEIMRLFVQKYGLKKTQFNRWWSRTKNIIEEEDREIERKREAAIDKVITTKVRTKERTLLDLESDLVDLRLRRDEKVKAVHVVKTRSERIEGDQVLVDEKTESKVHERDMVFREVLTLYKTIMQVEDRISKIKGYDKMVIDHNHNVVPYRPTNVIGLKDQDGLLKVLSDASKKGEA